MHLFQNDFKSNDLLMIQMFVMQNVVKNTIFFTLHGLNIAWNINDISAGVCISERNSVVVGSNLTQANFL